jgi:hypothetical protein
VKAPDVIHAGCPEKRNLYPPTFSETDRIITRVGTQISYDCDGCRTVIRVFIPLEVATNDETKGGTA